MNDHKHNIPVRHLVAESPMEWNVLQVAIDDMILDLEDLLDDGDTEERAVIEERLAAAKSLKEKLSEDF